MGCAYNVFEFAVSVGNRVGEPLRLRVHAQTRELAWARVMQMHPRAVEVPLEKQAPRLAQGWERGLSPARHLALTAA